MPPGPGRRGTGTSTRRHGDRSPLLPSRSSSSSSRKSPAGCGRPVWSSRGGRKSGSSGTLWSILRTFAPMVQILDVPVPQMVDQLVDVLKLFDNSVPEHVIDVPKVSQDAIPQRTVLCEPQLAEQLVEVPTVPFFRRADR